MGMTTTQTTTGHTFTYTGSREQYHGLTATVTDTYHHMRRDCCTVAIGQQVVVVNVPVADLYTF